MASVSSTSSQTSTQSSSTLSGINGIGGLASGIDTDSLVASLTQTEQTKIDKQNQQITKLEWQQEAYREIISKMQTFQNKYMSSTSSYDITRSSTFNTITANASSTAVSVTTNAESYSTSFTIDSVTQLASGKKIQSGVVSGNIKGSVNIKNALLNTDNYADPDSIEGTVVGSLAGKSLSFTLDGTTKVVTFDESFVTDFYDALNGGSSADEAFTTALQAKLDDAFGSGRATVSFAEDGGLTFDTATSSGLSIYSVNSDNAPLELLGITNGATNKLSLTKQISSMADVNAFATALTGGEEVTEGSGESASTYKNYSFSINGVEFTVSDTSSIRSVMNQINNSSAGVELTYSEITDTFTMTSKTTGAGSNIELSDDTGNFLAALGLTDASSSAPTVTEGQSAIFTVDGVQVERDTNTNVSVNGVFLTLNKTTNEAVEITTESDTSSVKDLVTNFVNDYNEVIEMINKYRTDETNRDYSPLTDAQKEEMTDKQIEKWEEKAKAGILRNDSTLNALSSKLSSLMYTSFDGFSLYEMGVQSAGYGENGKLTIDETKLDKALSEKSEQVKDFFLGETGFGEAIEDAFNSAIKTSGAKGSRGSLIEKAGMNNTASDKENNITSKIEDLKKYIKTLQERLESRQSYWWNKFSSLETLVNQMNSYSSIIGSYSSMG